MRATTGQPPPAPSFYRRVFSETTWAEPKRIEIRKSAGVLRRIFAFSGPAYLVAIGYMDPGNWATDIEGGSRFHYDLLWVILASNLIATLMQVLSSRLGVVTGR